MSFSFGLFTSFLLNPIKNKKKKIIDDFILAVITEKTPILHFRRVVDASTEQTRFEIFYQGTFLSTVSAHNVSSMRSYQEEYEDIVAVIGPVVQEWYQSSLNRSDVYGSGVSYVLYPYPYRSDSLNIPHIPMNAERIPSETKTFPEKVQWSLSSKI